MLDGFADTAGGGAEDGVFVGTFRSHVDIGVGELHLAAEWLAGGEVELADARFLLDATDVLLVHATACHDDDSSEGLLLQLAE